MVRVRAVLYKKELINRLKDCCPEAGDNALVTIRTRLEEIIPYLRNPFVGEIIERFAKIVDTLPSSSSTNITKGVTDRTVSTGTFTNLKCGNGINTADYMVRGNVPTWTYTDRPLHFSHPRFLVHDGGSLECVEAPLFPVKSTKSQEHSRYIHSYSDCYQPQCLVVKYY